MVKRYASDIANRKTYAKSVLLETLSHHLHAAADPHSFDSEPGLVHPVKPAARVLRFLTEHLGCIFSKDRAFTSGTARVQVLSQCHVTDVVLFMDATKTLLHAGQLWLLAEVETVSFAVLSKWVLDSSDPILGSAHWRKQDDLSIVFLTDLLCSVVWTEISPTVIRTLMPARFKHLLPSAA
jgi:hypothetical protein